MENSGGILGLREDEIELDLGLSIGGCFGKAEKLKPIRRESKPNNNSVVDLGESLISDPQQTKREIQALRRQEAKRKQEAKQQKKGISSSSSSPSRKCHQEDDMDATEERECKKNKVEEFSGYGNPNVSAELNNPLVGQIIPVRIPCMCPHVHFVPLHNGFAYFCANAERCCGGRSEKGVIQPAVMSGGFRPFPRNQDSGVKAGNGYDSEKNSSGDEKNRKTGSNGSPMCSSSIVSDLQSSSYQVSGGRSSETETHMNHSQLEHPEISYSEASNLRGHSEQNATSNPKDSAQSIDKSRKCFEKTASVEDNESTPMMSVKEKPRPGHESNLNGKTNLPNETTTAISLTKDCKGDIGKPPRPQTPFHNDMFALRNMPCVSTTGNGPNGKTINGFLYRYTKSEVSIICVCHGSSFTPGEFVEHAGGKDVSHPLRHITVIPSAF